MNILYKSVVIFDEIISKAVRIVCVLLILIATYALFDSYKLYYNAQNRGVLKYKPKLNDVTASTEPIDIPNSVAWLTIEDTPIDYPIMQGRNNSEYLNKNPLGEFSLSGSIYMDSRNNSDFSDPYSLIYGHHMEHDAMFGVLDSYEDQEFFNTHRDGILIISGSNSRKIRIFAVMKCLATDEHIFSVDDGIDHISYIKANADIFEEQDNYGHILALSTCSDTVSEDRLAVFAVIFP